MTETEEIFFVRGLALVIRKGRNDKKVFVSLRLCMSSLHRDANLLCIFKRLFNVSAQRLDTLQRKINL